MKKLILLAMMFWGVAYGQSTLYLRGDSVMMMKQGGNAELILMNGTRSVTNGLLQNIGNGRTRFVSLDSITTAPLANNGATLSGDTVQLGGTLTKATTIEGLNFPVEWTFNTLGATTGYKVSSTSTVNPTTLQRLMEVNLSGSISGTSKTTTGLYVSNTHNYSGMGFSSSIGAHIVAGDTTDSNSTPIGLKINTYVLSGDANIQNGGIFAEHYNDYSINSSGSFGIKAVIRGGALALGSGRDSIGAIVAINEGSRIGGVNEINSAKAVYGRTSGPYSGHNVGGWFTASNGRKNFAIVAADGYSAFMTAGDSTDAILGIGAADSARASLIIEEASQDFEDFRDGAIWHFNDTLWGRFGGTTYNLLSGEGGAGSQDLQQTFDNGTWLDKANTINQDGFLIQWNGPNEFNDTTATQISQRSFNSGVDYFIYTPISQDTVVDVEINVIDGFKTTVTDGVETHVLQVNGNGIFAEGLVFNDGAALRNMAIDTLTGEIYTTALGGTGANTALSNLASVAINTTLLPGSNDGAGLGNASFSFSDLFLAEGAVINFDNGDLTLTQTGDALALAGGGFSVPAGTTGARTLTVGTATMYSPGTGILEGSEFWTIKATNARHLIGESSSSNLWGALAWDHTNNHLRLYHSTVGASDQIGIFGNGNVGIGVTAATGRLHLAAGTATASTGPLKFTSGTLTTAAEAGLNEYNGNFYATKVNDVRFGVGGALHNNVTSDAVTGSGAEDLMTYSVPAGTLSTDGSYIEVKAVFNFVTTGQTITIDFGGTSVVSYTSVNTGNYYVEGTITRTGAATQMAYFKVVGEDNAVYITTPAETLSGAITLKGTGDGIGAGDITQYQLNVKYFPN